MITCLGIFFLLWIVPSCFLVLAVLLDAGFGHNLIDAAISVFFLLSPVLSLVIGIGLLKRKEWGRFSAVLMSLIMAIIPSGILLREYYSHPQNSLRQIRPMSFIEEWLIPVSVVLLFSSVAFFLSRPSIKRQFAK